MGGSWCLWAEVGAYGQIRRLEHLLVLGFAANCMAANPSTDVSASMIG